MISSVDIATEARPRIRRTSCLPRLTAEASAFSTRTALPSSSKVTSEFGRRPSWRLISIGMLEGQVDAAGMAEMQFGAGRAAPGLVIMLTLGTGIGSALFMDGHLVPNTELGHLVIRGRPAEERASSRARVEQTLA